jgi:hypothetical protein
MDDTTAQAAEALRDGIRKTAPVVRMRQALAHSEAMRELALTRLRAQHPERTTLALVEMLLGQRFIVSQPSLGDQ